MDEDMVSVDPFEFHSEEEPYQNHEDKRPLKVVTDGMTSSTISQGDPRIVSQDRLSSNSKFRSNAFRLVSTCPLRIFEFLLSLINVASSIVT
ncbi:hypothetical protein Ccrd_010687 [Cynara cardunculus var. scolymus]|uniref:Uncharacterized protein n=1 Tax=Cynara cardunculus var. scolymus TaxID=59895 RepID=A0A124SHX6_CYNCS|nr:hypothetical protein Ccrd_010687 [Cynara cardunculus var. scolymus]